MKQFAMAFLCLLIIVQCSAQNAPVNIYEVPPYLIGKKFEVDLGKGNKMFIELSKLSLLSNIKNLDSIVDQFLMNAIPLKDSFADQKIQYKIDYLMMDVERAALKLTKYAPNFDEYMLSGGEVSKLRTKQDSILILGKIKKEGSKFRTIENRFDYYRVTFVLNQLNDLELLDSLNNHVEQVGISAYSKWNFTNENKYVSKKYNNIYAGGDKGGVGNSDHLYGEFSVGLQNYGERLLGSFRATFGVILRENGVEHKIGTYSESPLVFAKQYGDAATSDRFFKNSFIGIEYYFKNASSGFSSVRSKNLVFPYLTVGYLIRRDGNYFEKNTFQVGISKFFFLDNTLSVEPMFFINKKYVAPSIKLTVPLF